MGCLGEIGPTDLTTLVLHPEKTVVDSGCSPIELLSGHVVSLLSSYLHDYDHTVALATSEALYIVLKYKEPRKMAGTLQCKLTHF